MKNIEKKEFRIVFMGTPDFAVESLKALVENGYNVVGVITMPDKPAGRGYKLKPSPVKQYALQQGLKVLQPEKLRDEGFLSELKQLNADLQVVAAFRMLPEVVWNMPLRGTFNLHSSLLPRYRGAAPINWAIINGEEETGVTTFFLTHDIDTGAVIFQEATVINPDDTAGTLHDRLMTMGAALVLKTVDAIIEDKAPSTPQSVLITDEESLKPAPKIFSDDCRINWKGEAGDVYNFIRGLSPYPTAWTELHSKSTENPLRVKVYGSKIVNQDPKISNEVEIVSTDLTPGTILTDNKSYLHVVVSDGFIAITDLQLPGKKRLKTVDLLNGYRFDNEARFV